MKKITDGIRELNMAECQQTTGGIGGVDTHFEEAALMTLALVVAAAIGATTMAITLNS